MGKKKLGKTTVGDGGKRKEGKRVDSRAAASPQKSVEWGTRQQLADRLGISRRRVGQLIAEGKIVETVDGIDLDRAVGEYQRKTNFAKSTAARTQPLMRATAAASASVDGDGPSASAAQNVFDFNEARGRKEHYNADLARIRFLKESGELVPRDAIESREFAIARVIRDRLLGLPSRVANLAPPDAVGILENEIKTLLREMQDAVREITKVKD